MEISVNGKFLNAVLEGMPRVGRELLAAFDTCLKDERFRGIKMRVLIPRNTPAPFYNNIEVKQVGYSQGFIWEQVELPIFSRGQYLLNFTGTAPVILKNGCVVIHDAQFRSTPKSFGWKSRLLYGLVTPIVAKRYTKVITVSNYGKAEIETYKVSDRPDIEVIYHGVDHVLQRDKDLTILRRLDLLGRRFMLANSYTYAHKNVRTLLDTMTLGANKFGPLVLFGTHSEQRFREMGIAVPANVIFAGRIADEELVSLMSAATVFLCPSTTEGFGLPPLEAMALSCPVICSKAGAMPEVCGPGALYAEPHSPASWLQQINRIFSDDALRDHLVAIGRPWALRYTWRKAAEHYLEAMKSNLSA